MKIIIYRLTIVQANQDQYRLYHQKRPQSLYSAEEVFFRITFLRLHTHHNHQVVILCTALRS